MWATEELVRASVSMRREEAERLRLVSEARRQAGTPSNGRTWHWRVEAGMEGAFRDLLGWLLSSQRDAPVEGAPAPLPETAPEATAEASAESRERALPWCGCWPSCCPSPS